MSIYDTDFEPQVKELVSLIDNTIDILNKRVEAKKEAYEREKKNNSRRDMGRIRF